MSETEIEARREFLARQLSDTEREYTAQTAVLDDDRRDIDAKIADLRGKIIALESRATDIAFRRADLMNAWNAKRDTLWAELERIPCPRIVSFLQEIESRLETAASLRDGTNSADVLAYEQALLRVRDHASAATRSGVDGKNAGQLVGRLRSALPTVRRSINTPRVAPG